MITLILSKMDFAKLIQIINESILEKSSLLTTFTSRDGYYYNDKKADYEDAISLLNTIKQNLEIKE